MKRKVLLLLCALALVVILGGKYYNDRYVFVAGKSVSRTAQSVDMRETTLSVSDYRKLKSKLPDLQVLWYIPFQGNLYDSTTPKLEVTALTAEDLEILELFPELTRLDGSNCRDYDALLEFYTRHPSCEVVYQNPLAETAYDSTIQRISITDPDISELKEGLRYFPHLKRLTMSGKLPESSQIEELAQKYPNIDIRWDIALGQRTFSSRLTDLNLSGISMTYQGVVDLLQQLPNTKKVNLVGCGLTDAEMFKLIETYPHIFFVWEMTFGNLLLRTDSEEIDISGQILQSTKEVEDILCYFPNIKKVVMCDCGFDDETMDALNKRYEDIRFVWSIKVKNVSIRTDTTFFYPFKYHREMTVNNADLYPLRYCTDIEAVDIGHMWGVTDCEWAAFMPKLKYLILVETQITDLTPLTNCKELVFLEIFKTQIRDYSPLLECTALEDINMCRTYGDYRPIAQMTWLKNIWWNGIAGTVGFPCSGAEKVLPEALPNTKLVFNQFNNSYYNGWRDLANYKRMRDVMGMFYLR